MKGQPENTGALHFIGIGGIGMSGIAEMMDVLGYKVQGSDQAAGANVTRLQEKGIRALVGHRAENIYDENGNLPAAVVISTAVKNNNPELIAARAAKVPVMRRAEMLAELMRHKNAVAVSGTHGKTTTTSMIGQMLETAGFDPTVINGGIVNAYGTNIRPGQGEWIVAEADESDGTFNRLPACVAVVTNMDPEHLDHYGNFDAVKAAYRQFIHNLPFYGYAVLCCDHPEVQALIASITDRKIITYGFNPQADVRASNVRLHADGAHFDVTMAGWLFENGKEQQIKDIELPMMGRHNVQNALVALTIAQQMDVPVATMKKALASLTGVKRRFTKTGEVDGITIIDDYAHHPIEIETVLKAARTAVEAGGGRVIAVAQPHRYTRLHDLFDEFCTCFNEADSVLIADVYEAGETPIEGACRDSLVKGIAAHGHRDVSALAGPDELAARIADLARPGDIVICMGAGNITQWAYALPDQLKTELSKRKGQVA